MSQSTLNDAYFLAQQSIAQLKAAVRIVLELAGDEGLRNADIGRSLGIYRGHIEHEGHIPRTLLAILESEGVVEQDKATKRWRIFQHISEDRNVDSADLAK